MQKLLQTPLRRLFVAMFMIALTVLSACKDDDGTELPPVTVDFPSNGSVTIAENAPATTINLSLSGAAPQDGKITITASSNATGALTFDSEITVSKGNTIAILHIDPTDNSAIDGGKAVTLTIASGTTGFNVGTKNTYVVNIVDDEGPTTANFSESAKSVSEADVAATTVTISLTPKATAAGSVTVTIAPADAGITTTPAAASGVITIPVAVGDEAISFTFVPVNNEANDGDATVKFTLGGSDGVEVGTSKEYTLTITDDDAIVPETILSIREMYADADLKIEEDLYIKGVITSVAAANANVHQNGMYVQDASGAIFVYFDGAHEKVRGKEVMINLNGSTLTSFNGLLEISGALKANLTEVGDGTLPAAKLITVEQLASGDYESQLVKLENVSFPAADGIITMNGTRAISDGTNTSTVFTRSQATFKDEILPLGSGTIQGIVSDFNGIQLLPQVFATDIFASQPDGTINLSIDPATGLNFGDVATGTTSASKSYTITGTTLSNDIVITSSNGYTISTDDASYSSSLTLPASGGQVYVKFSPASGINGEISGTITHKSQGSVAVTVAVTGKETGNGASSVVFTEGFDYPADAILNSNAVGYSISSGNTNILKVGNGNGLDYAGYPLAGGNAVALATSGEDVYKSFTAINSGAVYMSFLINLSAAQATGDYFIGLSPSASQTSYTARVHAKSSGAGYVVGLKKSNETNASYGSTLLNFGTTYLIVVKYTFLAPVDPEAPTPTPNDVLSLFVNPATAAEPATGEVNGYGDASKTDSADLGIITLRQGTGSSAPTLVIDGIRVASVWADLFK